jgi:hypothetical protein
MTLHEAQHGGDLSDCYGYSSAFDRLRAVLSESSGPAVWLIEGPRHLGKASLAAHLAVAGLSASATVTRGRTLEEDDLLTRAIHPDGTTVARFVERSHPDMLWLRPSERASISVEECRGLRQWMMELPSLSGVKYAIIDSIDDTSLPGQQSLLKLVEEPPSYARLLVLAHRASSVLPTMRSRMPTVSLRPLPVERMVRWVEARLPMWRSEAGSIAWWSGGCVGEVGWMAEDPSGWDWWFRGVIPAVLSGDFANSVGWESPVAWERVGSWVRRWLHHAAMVSAGVEAPAAWMTSMPSASLDRILLVDGWWAEEQKRSARLPADSAALWSRAWDDLRSLYG